MTRRGDNRRDPADVASGGAAHRSVADLWRLAGKCGIKPAYTNNMGERVRATPEALLAGLQAWGVEIDRVEQAAELIRQVDADTAGHLIEPVTVSWQGRPARADLWRATEHRDRPVELSLAHEDGGMRTWQVDADELSRTPDGETLDGHFEHVVLPLPDDLPIGRHTLHVDHAGRHGRTILLVAPPRCWSGPGESLWQTWGAFLPLYALTSERSDGIGDLTDLHRLTQWVGGQGGGFVGTLPLLALFLDEPFEPSPYSPVSRMFFNELYLDPDATAELAASPEARRYRTSREYRDEAKALRSDRWIDYRRVNALKRPLIGSLAETLCSGQSNRLDALRAEVDRDPLLGAYARFRAVTERRGMTWQRWPADLEQRARNDQLRPGADYDPLIYRYHLAAQWLLREQLLGADGRTDAAEAALYLDLPVGVNPGGFDAWWFAEAFAGRVSAGAPPDAFFSGGQNWGFTPIHPQRSRLDGHAGFAAAIAAHLRYCGALRIDHVMWLHRMFWIPDGLDASDGMYVRYPSEELYAILCIESHRHRAAIVGENLGTVPPVVNRSLKRRGIRSLYVGQFSFTDREDEVLTAPGSDAVASLNTHDVPPFAAFWRGDDIEQRVKLDLLDEEEADAESIDRAALRRRVASYLMQKGWSIDPDALDDESVRTALCGLHEHLAQSPADLVLVNLEDCWLERESQNMPGTTGLHNWRRRAAYCLEEIERGAAGKPLEAVRRVRHDHTPVRVS